MAHIYNSQLDAFELYHQVHGNQDGVSSSYPSPHANALPALGHAVAGSVGSAISNVCTYPLDLIITRLQIQRQLGEDLTKDDEDGYNSIKSTARRIYESEGGMAAFYAGLLQDTGKTIADSFLFFLVYSFLRRRRLARKPGGAGGAIMLPVLDELGIGFVAGSLTKLLTMPIANIVTKKQTSAIIPSRSDDFSSASSSDAGPKSSPSRSTSTAQIVRDILRERGIRGFWSGYSAVLILTLNPSLTFFLFESLKRFLLPPSRRKNPPPSTTFFLAAISKACASSVTYPFSVAKVRAQVGSSPILSTDTSNPDVDAPPKDEKATTASSVQSPDPTGRTAALSAILKTIQSDGIGGFYSGLSLELVKSFLSHGTTMIVKQYVHHFVIQAYYILSLLVVRLRSRGLKAGAQTEKLVDRARAQRFEYYDLARSRAEDRVRQGKENAGRILEAVTDLGGELVGKANETAELVADYVEEETEEWRSLYGTGLARWFDEK